ncbi:putative FAD-linked oxidoreductase [Roseovarius albus]|uniref:Putative FAD-linked oxidoreductase n=1 Tax=Roseovarius albus TaxID=1247867 RepID=A0A1X6YFX3_9RHOB|nr:FAD-binding oxidoreductase [Roseovarius albus]SLN20435.1 putative FAD-linked oxidoreductase [Roseovarius albus]
MTVNSADEQFVEALQNVLPSSAFRPVEPRYLEEPRGRWFGKAGIVVAPDRVEDVATVVRCAFGAQVPVMPYSGGTGLVGGQVMPDGPAPVLLSLERMNKIRATYPDENTIVAEAGVILSDLHEASRSVDRLFPLSIAAKGSARLGGLLSTNAGGVNVLRYGNARDLCLGLEAVLPDGQIWHGLKRLRKDNMGYDLRNLLIGAEGTLGVITAATLKLNPRPAHEGTALMVVPDPAAALKLLAMAQAHVGEGISGFELMARTGLEFLAQTMPEQRQPFEVMPEWFVLIDLGLAQGLDPAQALEKLFVQAMEQGLVSDGVIAQSEAQRQVFWDLRENIPEGNKRIGSISSHDISVPMGAIPDFILTAKQRLAEIGTFRINCFGHLGDGNLHFNVFPPKGESREAYRGVRDHVQRAVHDLVHEMQGSVSAEHGIGRLKVPDLERYEDPVKLQAMRTIKSALDPKGIMNPGAVLRDVPAP